LDEQAYRYNNRKDVTDFDRFKSALAQNRNVGWGTRHAERHRVLKEAIDEPPDFSWPASDVHVFSIWEI
jgi:hypothetical protein